MPQIDNLSSTVMRYLQQGGDVEALLNWKDGITLGNEAVLKAKEDENGNNIKDTYATIASLTKENPLIVREAQLAEQALKDGEGKVIHETYFQGGMKTFISDVELNNSESKGIYHSISLGLIVCFFESDTVTPSHQLWFKPNKQEPYIRTWDTLDKTYGPWNPYFAGNLLITEQEFDAIKSEHDTGTYWVGKPLDYYVAWIYHHNVNLCRMRIKNGVLEESTLNGTEWTSWRNKNNNAPLILSLKQDTITKKYQIVNSNGEQVLFNEIFTEAQSRPVYCHATDGVSLLPLSILDLSMIMFVGIPCGAETINYCEIQYSGENGNVLVIERPLIVPEMSDNLDEGTYLGSAPSLNYLEQYVMSISSKIIDKHINQYPDRTIKSNEVLDICYGDGVIYRLIVYMNEAPNAIGYGWLFVNYIDTPEHNWSQILIDLDGQIYSRHKDYTEWTEWQPIGSGGGGTYITVDSLLDGKSINPVQNKVISDYLDALNYYGNMNFRPTSDSCFKFSGGYVESYSGSALMEVIVPYYYYGDSMMFIVNTIGASAFQGEGLVESIVLPNTIEVIESLAFAECSILEKIRLPNRLRDLPDQVFFGCKNLTSITLPITIANIGVKAFDGSGLTDVYYEGTKEQWESINISEDNDTLNNATIHFNWTENYTISNTQMASAPVGIYKVDYGNGATFGHVIVCEEDGIHHLFQILPDGTIYRYGTTNQYATYNESTGELDSHIVAHKAIGDKNGNEIDGTYATKAEVANLTKAWLQGQKYSAGDMVIAQVANENADGFYTVVLVCIQDHTASSDWILPTDDELFSERWSYNSDYALHSKFDDKRNDIAKTYATKKEVGDISTALDAIIAIDNKLLGVSE